MNLFTYQAEKTLCEKSIFLGLTEKDFILIGLFYALSYIFFKFFNLDIFALILTFIFLLFLIPIRIKYRPQIIRDFFFFLFYKIFKQGFYYAPKNY